jgi:prevent-host-death family protein
MKKKSAILDSMEAGIRDLRDNLSRYLEQVRQGEEVIVTDHGKAVARLVPLAQPRRIDQLIAEGRITPAKRPKRQLLPPAIKTQGSIVELFLEEGR